MKRYLNLLSVRLTHKYAPHWKHLDQWRDLGTYSVLNARVIKEAQDFDEVDTIAYTLRVDSTSDRDSISFAIREAFNEGGCDHEHDCCGCVSTYATDVRHVKRREWVVVVRGYRNY